MHILLFIVYTLLCAYGIFRIPFIRNSGIRPAILLAFFALHVCTGLLHNYIAWHYFPQHGDIWNFYEMSFAYRHDLVSDFSHFLEDNATLTYITHNGILCIHVLLNVFSFDSLSVNTLLFSFPVFLGNVALFRLLRKRFPNTPLAAFTVFLLPSTLFWTACIHREGMIYMLLGFLFYSFDRWVTLDRSARRRFYFILCFLLILYFRFSIALSLLPALLAWYSIEKHIPRRRIITITGAGLLLLIVLILVCPGLFQPLTTAIIARQHDFSSLEGSSRLSLPLLDNTWTSVGKVFPAALRNGFFEPLPGSGGKALYSAFAIELLLIWALVAAALLRVLKIPPSPPTRAFILCCLVFTLSGLLFIGAMVPFAGAIVRYRSIFLPFLLAPALYILHPLPLFCRIDNWLTTRLLSPTP